MKLWTLHGEKAIEDLKAGDLLAARSEFDPDGEIVLQPIEEVFTSYHRIWHVHVDGQVIRTTSEHPFWVRQKGWLPAGNLQIGDELLTHDGRWLPVEDLCDAGVEEEVYNFRVTEYHTYFVGGMDWGWFIWAHNLCTGKYKSLGNGIELRTYEITSLKTGNKYYRQIEFNTKTNEADFSRFYLRDAKGNPVIETIQYTGSRKADFRLANAQRGKAQPSDYTWHHLDYDPKTGMGRMVLVKTEVHSAVGHSGGVSRFEAVRRIKYRA